MKTYALLADTESCVGCYACEVACKQENATPWGSRWMRVEADGPKKVGDSLKFRYVPLHCMHCTDAPCARECPVDAIYKEERGIILIDYELCTGCKKCLEACPFGVMQFNEETGKAEMCNLCLHRIKEGRNPACTDVCPAHCLYFGTVSEIAQKFARSRLNRWR